MGLAYDVLIASVITAITAIIQYVALELFAPNQQLYAIATDGTAVLHGAERAWLWTQMLTVWVPILIYGGVWAWVLVSLFRRQIATGQGRVRAP